MLKKFMSCSLAVVLVIVTSFTALASGWQQNDKGWWYGTNADDSAWFAGDWFWVDGNGDGIAECYLFNGDGYIYTDCVTPDGFTVNADGAWTENGEVKTQTVTASGSTGAAAQATMPTDEQKAVIEELLPMILYRYRNNGTTRFADLSNDNIANIFYGILNNVISRNSSIVTCTGTSYYDVNMGTFSYQSLYWDFDKVSALKNISDLLGRNITEEILKAYNNSSSWDLFKITNDKISITPAEGEGASLPDSISYSVDGNNLIVSVAFTTWFNEGSGIPGYATVIFEANPESFCGYTLVSMTAN